MNRTKSFKIISPKDIKIQELAGILKQYPFNYPQQFNLFLESTIIKYHQRKIFQLVHDKKMVWAVALRRKDKLIGLAILEKLPWESEYFKISMAKVSYLLCHTSSSREEYRIKLELFRRISELSLGAGIKHLCFETDVRDSSGIHAAESNSFKLMVTQLIYARKKKNIAKSGRLDKDYIIRSFRKEDIRQVLKIAMQSRAISRFHADESLPEEKRRAYYRVKTENCCLGKIAGRTFVLEKNRRIIGFYIFRYENIIEKPTVGYVISIALASEVQGRGIGPAFIDEVEQRLLKGVGIFTGRVHIANIPMIRTMNKVNAEFVYALHTFHKWI